MQDQPSHIGRHVVIWGATGSGKTTLAQRLGDKLGLAVIDLDAIRHADGWDSTPYDVFREQLTQRLERSAEGWVTAGNYFVIRDAYLFRADTLIWLRLPWRVSFWRLLQRTLRRAWIDEAPFEGSPVRESWRVSFLSRRSVLWRAVRYHQAGNRARRRFLTELPAGIAVHELRSAREVGAFLNSLAGTPKAKAG